MYHLLLIKNNFRKEILQKNIMKQGTLKIFQLNPHYTDKKAEAKKGKMMIQDNKVCQLPPRCLFLSNTSYISWQAVDHNS